LLWSYSAPCLLAATEHGFGVSRREFALANLGEDVTTPLRRDPWVALGGGLAGLDTIAMAKGDEYVVEPAVDGGVTHGKGCPGVFEAAPSEYEGFDKVDLLATESLKRPEVERPLDGAAARTAMKACNCQLVLADGTATDNRMHVHLTSCFFTIIK
jgi:hypothetical protein